MQKTTATTKKCTILFKKGSSTIYKYEDGDVSSFCSLSTDQTTKEAWLAIGFKICVYNHTNTCTILYNIKNEHFMYALNEFPCSSEKFF